MTLYLLDQWRKNSSGFLDATPFTLMLANKDRSSDEHSLIIQAFNDWRLLTPTWFQVADALNHIKALAEDINFPSSKNAWLLASKIEYCLGNCETAMHYALEADNAFSLYSEPSSDEVGPQDEYVSYKKCLIFFCYRG